MKDGNDLLPGMEDFFDNDLGVKESGGDARTDARIAKNFKLNLKKKMKLANGSGESNPGLQGRFNFPKIGKRVRDLQDNFLVPKPFNQEELFGLSEKSLLKQSERFENLPSVLYMYHGKNVLVLENSRFGGDPLRHMLQGLGSNSLSSFLMGVGKTHGRTFLNFSNPHFRDKRNHVKVLERSLSDFVYSMVEIGSKENTLDLGPRILSGMQIFQRMGKYESLKKTILKRYTKEKDFRILGNLYGIDYRDLYQLEENHGVTGFGRMNWYYGQIGFEEYRMEIKGSNVFQCRTEHPGKKYMASIIGFLKNRDYPSNAEI